jgi:hypothetical protein
VAKFGPLLIFLIGLHSIALGIVIYFYTDFFYQKFFSASVENIFFVRQSGVFLFLAGFFYLYPLIDLKRLYNFLLLIIFSKFIAVLFLLSNAKFTLAPSMIYLAAFFDGLMAVVLVSLYFQLKMNKALAKKGILANEGAAIEDAV